MSHPSRQLIYGSIAFLCILVAAVIGYVIIDHSSVLAAFYMVVLTIFGVGYEEAVPVESPLPNIFTIKEVDLILVALSLIDVSLVGGLIVMVMFSGYENFVSKLDVDESEDKLGWLGKLDTSSLKNKVSASIVAISSIHLLKVFMNTENIESDKIKWYLLLHITFVVSAFAMGYLDKITKK